VAEPPHSEPEIDAEGPITTANELRQVEERASSFRRWWET